MNSRVRALVWEEVRVGGLLVAECLVVGVLLLLRLRMSHSPYFPWRDIVWISGYISMAIPLLCALLLVLNIRNSGHLGGGFSRRILRMPVGTTAAVTTSMAIRLMEVMGLCMALLMAIRLLVGESPGWRTVFIVGMVYMLAQVVDWVRALATGLVFLLVVVLTALVLQYTGRWVWLFDFVNAMDNANLAVFLVGFAGVTGACYAVSLAAVNRTRLGWRVDPSMGAPLAELLRLHRLQGVGVFSSPQAAQYWYELRRTRLLLFQVTVGLFVAGTVGYVVVEWLNTGVPDKYQEFLGKSLASPIVTELIPLVALLVASVAWRLQSSWIGWRESRQLATGWTARHPVTKAQAARARMAVAACNLGLTLGAIAVLHITTFLLCDNAAVLRLLGDAWGLGATSPREMTAFLLGPILLAGLLAWVIMHLSTGMVAYALTLLTGKLFYDYLLLDADFIHGKTEHPHTLALDSGFMLALTLLFPVVLYLVSLAVVLFLGRVRLRAALLSLALWLGLALSLYPFSMTVPELSVPTLAGFCLGMAALAVMCWPNTVLRHGAALRTGLRRESPAQHARTAVAVPAGRRMFQGALLVLFCAGVAWMRWPAEPAAQRMLRQQGNPSDFTELNDSYLKIPNEKNLAVKYGEVTVSSRRLDREWDRVNVAANKDGKLFKNLLVVGGAEVKRDERIPQELWTVSKDYFDTVSQPVTVKLHEIAGLGLTESRYPVELRLGPGTPLPHLAALRQLSRHLALEAWVASVERRPKEAVAAVLDMLPIANSLSEEPLFISQLVRIAIQGITWGSLETVLNRCELPEGDLARVQSALASALPPLSEGPFLARSLKSEECVCIAGAHYYSILTDHDVGYNYYQELPGFFWSYPGKAVAQTTMDIMGGAHLTRLLVARYYERVLEAGAVAAKQGVLPNMDAVPFEATERMRIYSPLTAMDLSYIDRVYESEWRIRTQLDIARTALAVERCRLANGRLPERLEALVPAFLEGVPTDPWNGGKPLSYRLKENGEFVVYSFGLNGTDEKGEEMKEWWRKGDITFTVAPPDIRERAQVAESITNKE